MVQRGSSINCFTTVGEKLCPATAPLCAIKQNIDSSTETFCSDGTVGCTAETNGVIMCKCSENKCNENMAKAGFNAAAASSSGGLTNLLNNNEATSLRSETSLCLVVMIILSVIIGLH